MPGGGGLRRCRCGAFYLLRETIEMGFDAPAGTPSAEGVPPEALPLAVLSKNKAVELVARRQLWLHLNHAYRDLGKAQRQAQEEAALAAWQAQHPDTRSAWQKWVDKIRRKAPPAPARLVTPPLQAPEFVATPMQLENMTRLLALILEKEHETYGPDPLEVAELYRELGLFEQAKQAILACPENDKGVVEALVEQLIDEGCTALVRYRL